MNIEDFKTIVAGYQVGDELRLEELCREWNQEVDAFDLEEVENGYREQIEELENLAEARLEEIEDLTKTLEAAEQELASQTEMVKVLRQALQEG